MASLADALLEQITVAAQTAGQGSTLRVDQPAVHDGLAASIPLLLTALSRNAESSKGAASLHQALLEDHDGSVLDNLSSYLQEPDLDDGDGILKHALGDRRDSVQLGLAETTGLDLDTASQLLKLAAPLVLGMLAKQQRAKQLGPDELSNMLNEERTREAESKPDMMDAVASMLDMNKDGGIMDDLQGLASKLFGGRRN
jgi:hypothetical protein